MPFRLLESPRFRAGFDFLHLRCQSGEMPEELSRWWQDFQDADPDEREGLIDGARTPRGTAAEGEGPARKKRRRRSPRKSDKVSSRSDTEAGQEVHAGRDQPEEHQ